MSDTSPPVPFSPGSWHRLDHGDLQSLIDALVATGHRVVGPQVADGAIVLRDLGRAADLPHGWLDEQDGGHYRLRHDSGAGTFDHVVGPHSLKNFLFPPRETIQRWEREAGSWHERALAHDDPPLAVIGARACDLQALAVQDAVFIRPDHTDQAYAARRDRLVVVAVNCRRAVATCFCHSMQCGPAVTHSFDLALTERDDGGIDDGGIDGGGTAAPATGGLPQPMAGTPVEPARDAKGMPPAGAAGRWLAVEVGSAKGAALLAEVARRAVVAPLAAEQAAAARQVPHDLGARMHARTTTAAAPRPRSLDTDGIRDLLFANLDHPRWDEVATRCLSCTNCTLVCPTCFCHSVGEVADLSGDHVDRERRWASCFDLDHGRVHGGNARPTTSSRYRQWLTHKLAGWLDQFGTSGCTGCGRCITWCPVGIDITEEVAAIRAEPGARRQEGP
jgi:sulfhydrogenase subunit beta (sulfur reductase)